VTFVSEELTRQAVEHDVTRLQEFVRGVKGLLRVLSEPQYFWADVKSLRRVTGDVVVRVRTDASSHLSCLDESTIIAIDQSGPDRSAPSIDWGDARRLAGQTKSRYPTFHSLGQTPQCLHGVFAPIERILFSPARIGHDRSIRLANFGDSLSVEVNRDCTCTSGADLNGGEEWAGVLHRI
jgi:hypothetical protein